MNINTQIKQATAVPSPVSGEDSVLPEQGIQYAELWKVIRGVLVVWAVAVWLLLVMMPGIGDIVDVGNGHAAFTTYVYRSWLNRCDIRLLQFTFRCTPAVVLGCIAVISRLDVKIEIQSGRLSKLSDTKKAATFSISNPAAFKRTKHMS